MKRKSRSFTRSRSGCDTCKSRRKKCDEGKPTCKACQRLQLHCTYKIDLTWNMSNHRVHKVTTYTPKVSLDYMISATNHDFETSMLLGSLNTKKSVTATHKDNQNELIMKRIRDNHILEVNYEHENSFESFELDIDIEVKLFEYYINVVSEEKSFSNTAFNQFRTLVVPSSITSPALFQSIIAITAKDIHRKGSERAEYYAKVTSKYKQDAINSLYKILDIEPNFISNQSSNGLNEIIITILMLCSLEISDKGNMRWINHLKESCLVFGSLSEAKILSSETLLFAYRYFALRYILLLTTLSGRELNNIIETIPLPIIDTFFQNDKIDYMLGCSPRLLLLIYEGVLAQANLEASRNDVAERLFQLYNELGDLKQSLDENDDGSLQLYLCSRAYLLSAKVYLHNLFIQVSGKDDFKKVNPNYCFDDDHLIIRNLLGVLEVCTKKSDSQTLFPTWCLFIAGICHTDDEYRASILKIFQDLEVFWHSGSPTEILSAIKIIWRIEDFSFDPAVLKGDWRDILSIVGFKLALT